MKIITDNGADLPSDWLTEEGVAEISLHMTWENGEPADRIDRPAFYRRLARENCPPKTSQPSVGEFRTLYEQKAESDDEILSIHISSGLSGTVNSAQAAREMVPRAKIRVVDTLTLSGAQGWQVRAAVAAARAGDSVGRILAKLDRVRDATETVYTLDTLHYLMLGGRIGKVKGTVGSVLNIKPLIAVEKSHGTYIQVGSGRGLGKAMRSLANYVARQVGEGTEIVTQVVHAESFDLAEQLKALVTNRFQTHWLPPTEISPVLGAHTGPGLVGLAFAPKALLGDIELA